MNVLLKGGPADGRIKIVPGHFPVDGGIAFETPERPGARGWYGCVFKRNGNLLVDKQGFWILVWCGWDGEGIE